MYLATDPALGRPVALKVLAPALARDAAAVERFATEARTAGALEHPRIVPVHEIGRDGDAVYIAMAYREGVTLRERLRDGPLGAAEAVRIATEIAEGLAAAHAAGIVHRDIKPENVLLTARGACLLDFGIAKMAGQTLTMTGVTLGTPAYMSPEQTRGDAVDARTDLWSLGVVLHEMLAGERPFRGGNGDAIVYGVRHDAPPPLPRAVPAHVRRVVARCLAKAPNARPASAAEVVAALGTPDAPARGAGRAIAAALVAVACAGAAWLASRGRQAAPTAPVAPGALVALVPFGTDSTAMPPAYLTSGLFADVRGALSAALARRLLHPGSVRTALGQGDDFPTVARRLDAGALVTGTFRQRGDSLELALAVLDPDAHVRWSGTVARPLARAEALVRDARDRILGALGEPLPDTPLRTADPAAYDLLLRSRFAAAQSSAFERGQAPTLAAEAIARDSTLAAAYAHLATLQLAAPDASRPGARALLERAIALDSTLAHAWNELAQIVAYEDLDWARGEAMAARAVALDPSRPEHAAALVTVQLGAGRADAALATVLRLRELDPLTSLAWTLLGVTLLESRRADVAIGAMTQGLALDPGSPNKSNLLGRALLAAGRPEEAIGPLRNAGASFAGFEGRAVLAHALARAGRTDEARDILARYEARARAGEPRAADLAAIHLGLGDTARALDALERVPAEPGTRFFHVDPIWDPVRASPRFAAVLRRLRLDPAPAP